MLPSKVPGTGTSVSGPFNTLRDYVAFLESRGHLMRVSEIDQDNYEGTALMYRLIDEYGYLESPALLFERIKINGEWMQGPVLANLFGPQDIESELFGVDTTGLSKRDARRAGIDRIMQSLEGPRQWRRIPPKVVSSEAALCKEIVLTDDKINLLKYPWFRNQPADVGQYVNMAGVIMQDEELGKNVGLYRCQVKGERKIAVSPEAGQHGWLILDGKTRRGEKVADVALALGTDPLTFSIFPTKMAPFGVDEFEVAGGLMGKPLELVKCETSDLLVPANAEMIIEGEVRLDDFEKEGPYGEMFGYIGRAHEQAWYMNVKAITQRKDPWLVNSFTGVSCDAPGLTFNASDHFQFLPMIPNLVDMNLMANVVGVVIASIDKKMPGDGMSAGMKIAADHIVAKVIIIVDKDVDVCDLEDVVRALSSRWQPWPASNIVKGTTSPGAYLDPSAPVRGFTSKIVIDATRQFPAEGGPEKLEPVTRALFKQDCGDAFELVNRNWESYLAGWDRQ